ncbi:enolase [Methanocaldococcus villosus KIN24-T80]|uniref:Enolase n=1 Tax=Methanocaldococcus villosus KIN24-T80 TaxID=1069083 RepID=N6UUF1_9EURY|nr:hypothetical protein [Methanocaldococcus villosus]ENN95969.1 enolase [Methanocaldococcus villosus KIN24-T80]
MLDIIRKISAKKVFKGDIKVMITTITENSFGYEIIDTEEPDNVIAEINNVIAPELFGYSLDIDLIDNIICEVSENSLISYGVSVSVARAAANSFDIPLFKYLGGAITTDLPIVSSTILRDNNSELFPIVMAESIEDIVDIYIKLRNILDYKVIDINGAYVCKDIFNEIGKVREKIDEIKEEEDIEILLGLKIKKDMVKDKDLSLVDYLEVEEPVEFDGFLCTDIIYEESDFVKVYPYEIGTVTELFYYINYIFDKGLYPVLEGDNNSLAHIATAFKVPVIRAHLSSSVLNEVWEIERSISNPNIRRF